MATVASLDLSSYLQAVTQSVWSVGHYRPPAENLPRTHTVHDFAPRRCRADVTVSRQPFRSRDDEVGTPEVVATVPGSRRGDSSETRLPTRVVLGHGKRVTFADNVGRSLVTVHRYQDPSPATTIDPPPPPPSFHRGLRLEPGFRQPWMDSEALGRRLDRDGVALESCHSRGRGLPLAGTVLVSNVAYEKRVTVRCTFDFWRSFLDVQAVYVSSVTPSTDLFAFDVVHPDCVPRRESSRPGRGRYELAVMYEHRGATCDRWTETWDNNDGRNYRMLATW